MFKRAEFVHFILAILLLSIVFGYDDGSTKLIVSNWVANFIKILIIVTISILVHIGFQKLIASKFGAEVIFGLWGINRLSLKKTPEFPMNIGNKKINAFYIGPFIALITTLASGGKFFFAAVFQIFISPVKEKRLFKKMKELTNPEIVTIAISGPLISVLLAAIFLNLGWESGYVINTLLAIYTMLPLPRISGSHAFFSSPFSYIFFGIIILSTLFMIKNIGFIISIFLSIIIAFLITFSYYYSSQK